MVSDGVLFALVLLLSVALVAVARAADWGDQAIMGGGLVMAVAMGVYAGLTARSES